MGFIQCLFLDGYKKICGNDEYYWLTTLIEAETNCPNTEIHKTFWTRQNLSNYYLITSLISVQMGSDTVTVKRKIQQAFMTDMKAAEHSCTHYLYSACSTLKLAL